MSDPNVENPVNAQERTAEAPVVADVREVFEEKARGVNVGDELISAWEGIKAQIPENQRGSFSVRLTEWTLKHVEIPRVGTRDRVLNFLHNLTHPYVWFSGDLPKDTVSRVDAARVRAIGHVSAEKMRLQVAEREAFKQMIPFGLGRWVDIADRMIGPKIPPTRVV